MSFQLDFGTNPLYCYFAREIPHTKRTIRLGTSYHPHTIIPKDVYDHPTLALISYIEGGDRVLVKLDQKLVPFRVGDYQYRVTESMIERLKSFFLQCQHQSSADTILDQIEELEFSKPCRCIIL